jgi:hypothetical protein
MCTVYRTCRLHCLYFYSKHPVLNLDASLNIVIYGTSRGCIRYRSAYLRYIHFILGRVGAATTGEAAVAAAGAAGPGVAATTTTTTGLPAAAAGDSAGEGTTTTTGGDGAVAAAATTTGTCCCASVKIFLWIRV